MLHFYLMLKLVTIKVVRFMGDKSSGFCPPFFYSTTNQSFFTSVAFRFELVGHSPYEKAKAKLANRAFDRRKMESADNEAEKKK